jgi:hypothetical protein
VETSIKSINYKDLNRGRDAPNLLLLEEFINVRRRIHGLSGKLKKINNHTKKRRKNNENQKREKENEFKW